MPGQAHIEGLQVVDDLCWSRGAVRSKEQWGKCEMQGAARRNCHALPHSPLCLLPHRRDWDRLSVTHSENKGKLKQDRGEVLC